MDIKDGLLGKVPFVTIAFALAMTICFGLQFFAGGGEGGQYEELLLRAQTFYERNPGVQTTPRQRSLLGAEFIGGTEAAHAARGDAPVFSARMRKRTQTKFEQICDEAIVARTKEDPAWRHGITGANVPAHRYFTYAFFHDGVLAFAVTLVFLLLAGLGLEMLWGPVIFAPVAVVAVVVGGAVFAHGDAASHVPLSGGGPLVAALLGAYLVRGAGGSLPLPGALLLGAWFFVDALFVRGIWIDTVGDWPWLTLGLSAILGAGFSAGVRVMGVEAKLADTVDTLADGRHPALAEAEGLTRMGRLQDAFILLSEAVAETPGDSTLALAYWDASIEAGRSDEAVDAILPILQAELRTGDIDLATLHWRQVRATRVPVEVSTTVLVRMGEALLDVGEPEEALDSLRRALDAPAAMGSALAQRVVRIARDLDPVLTGRAAGVALLDPQIDAETRANLEALSGGAAAAPSPTPVVAQAHATGDAEANALAGSPAADAVVSNGTTAALAELAQPDIEADLGSIDDLGVDLDDPDIDLSHVGELTSPEEFADLDASDGMPLMELDAPGAQAAASQETDPNALSIQSLERELASGLEAGATVSATDPADWNDPGLVEDLSDELDSGPPSLIAEADLDSPVSDDTYLDAGALSAEALSAEAQVSASAGSAPAPPVLGDVPAEAPRDAGDSLGDATDPLRPQGAVPGISDLESPPTEPLLGLGGMAARAEAVGSERVGLEAEPTAKVEDPVVAPPLPVAGRETPVEAPKTPSLAASPMRALKVLDAVPLALEADAMKFDVQGRGKTRLPFARIDAVSVAAVSGLSAKPVLVIDFVLNWNGDANEPLKVIRVRSDGFNPGSLVGSPGAPLESIKTLIRRVLDGAQAVALPDAGAAMGSPFSVHDDLESYQRDILMAS